MAQDGPVAAIASSPQRLPSLAREVSRFAPHDFVPDRLALTQALFDLRERLNTAIRPAPLEVDLLLDLAALHLSQRMLPEARSFLAALPGIGTGQAGPGGARLSPLQQGRAAVLAAAVDGFSGAETASPQGWSDAALFDALAHIGRGDHAAARPLLSPAVQILSGYPRALSDPVRPRILWAAIETDAWDVARDLAGQMGDTPDSSAYRFLLGRAAERGGNLLAAFDNYAAGAAGSDEWAQRARLALIDLGRATRSLSSADARRLLLQTRAIWRGGPLALATLQRLAALELTEPRLVPALEVLAQITRLYPGTPEAEAATERALQVMEEVYASGLRGDLSLSDFMTAHRAIARDYRFVPDFDRHAEAFADHLAATGASGLAAAEYEELRRRIAARVAASTEAGSAEDVATPTLDDRPEALRLKQAAALMQVQRLSEAETLLALPLASSNRDLRDRFNLLRARIFAVSGRHADVLGTQMVAPNRDYLRLRARAAFALSDWYAARESYEQLWRSLGSALPTEDRINLLLATHRSGDPARLQELIASFPDLGDHWSSLAAGLNAAAPDVLPLRGEAARERVENADQALRLLQAAGGGTMP